MGNQKKKKIINCFLKIFFKTNSFIEYLLHFPNIFGSCTQTNCRFFIVFFFFLLRSQLGINRIKELINLQQQTLSLVEHAPSKLATEKKVSLSKLRNAQQHFLALQCERKKRPDKPTRTTYSKSCGTCSIQTSSGKESLNL